MNEQTRVPEFKTSAAGAAPSNPNHLWWTGISERLHSSHIPGLDGVRALAVFLVIFYHFGIDGINGALGVTMFFVLSGFLITWLLLKEHTSTHRVDLKAFYGRRMFRIFPAFYVFWIFTAIVYVLRGHDLEWGVRATSAVYLGNYYLGLTQDGHDSVLAHTWSLAVEEQFYLLWPIILIWCRARAALLIKVLAGIIVAVWLWRPLLFLGFHLDQRYIYHAFDTRADALMVGCLLAVVLRRGLLVSLFRKLCSHPTSPLISAALLSASSYFEISDPSGVYRFTVGYLVEPLVIALFIVQMITLTGTRAWHWVEHSVVRYLGRISYSLYLYQQLTLFTARRLTANLPTIAQLLFALLVTVAFATASYFVIEKPILAFGRRYLNRFTSVPARTATAAV